MTTLNWAPRWTQEEATIFTINWWKKVLLEKIDPLEACLSDIERYATQNG